MAAQKKTMTFLVLAYLHLAPFLAAQVSGDCVVVGHHIGPVALDVAWVSADGARSGSFFSSGTHSGGAGLTQAPANDGVVFTCQDNMTRSVMLYHYSWWGTLSSTMLPSPFSYVPTILVDQNGDLLLLNQAAGVASSGIYRMPMPGSNFSTLVTSIPSPVAMEEDLVTGHFLVADATGTIHRVTRSGQITSVAKGVFPAMPTVRSKMHRDFTDGSVLETWGNSLFRYDPNTGTTATLLSGGTTSHVGLDHDPVNGDYYRGDTTALLRYDPSTGQAKQLRQYGMYSLSDVATWGGRILTGTGPCKPGAVYPIHLSLYSECGRYFQAAASFGTLFGIPTPGGRIPLDPGPLFFFSLANPMVFAGFSGQLSRSGTASLRVNIPNVPALKGIRFYVAMVTYDATGIRKISEPLGMTIE